MTPEIPKLDQTSRPARRNGRWSGYRHLLWARIIELKREPEVVFWVFIFPLLLAAGLGIAFRNKPADITAVVVIAGDGAQRTLAMLQNSADRSSSEKNSTIRATVLDRDAALKAFHVGKYDLAIESKPDGSYTYYYDPARPESVLSRAEIDAALQSAAGRKDALTSSAQSSSEPGSRYIGFLIPGLLGMNLMNSGMWGVGFALVEMRQRKLLKRFVAADVGVGFIARSNIHEDVRTGLLAAIDIADAQVRRDMALVFRKDKAMSRAALAFIDIAVKHKSTEMMVPGVK